MLNMRGPDFLALYALVAVLAYRLVAYIISRRERDNGGPDPRQLRDPYAIAYLRGGARELLRVVVLSLTLREKLILEGNKLMSAGAAAEADSAPPIELAVLRAAPLFITAAKLARTPQVQASIEDYRQELIRAQLLAGPETFRARLPVCLAVMAGLIALAGAKIYVALSTGHRNIDFLLVLTVVAVLSLLIPLCAKRTALGRRALEQLRALFGEHLPLSSDASGVPSEAALLAAVFGVYALAGQKQKAWAQLWGVPPGGAGGAGGGVVFTGGDSGSSSGGSSCGGGGGGGGGGSGCGGCGGH